MKLNTLDLHGVKHKDVEDKVYRFLHEIKFPCYIITGNSESMKKLVFSILERHDYKFCVFSTNLGKINILE
jgi:hypothetical protein